jgi:hypothetical protein
MSIRLLVGLMLLATVARGDELVGPTAGPSTPAERAVSRGELLRIELTSPGAPEALADLPPGSAGDVPALEVIHVRVGEDGFARFPVTERALPFAELELPVVAAMLTAHLELHGHPAAQLTVEREKQAAGLVTVLGLVARPGVYQLPANATLDDAITAAGGIVGEPQPTPVAPDLSPVLPDAGPLVSIPSRTTLKSTPQFPASHRSLQVRLEHQALDLQALAKHESSLTVSIADLATTRLCIDGVILHVEPRPPAPPDKASDDLFTPL